MQKHSPHQAHQVFRLALIIGFFLLSAYLIDTNRYSPLFVANSRICFSFGNVGLKLSTVFETFYLGIIKA